MRRLLLILFCLILSAFTEPVMAILSMELTRGVAGAIPIAIVPFSDQALAPQKVSEVIQNDLYHSGRFKVTGSQQLTQFPTDAQQISRDYFKRLGTDNIVVGKVTALSEDRYQVNFQLVDLYQGQERNSVILNKKYVVSGSQLRALSHHISDLIYEQLTGVPGIFSTHIAYVVVQRASNGTTRYRLEVADQGGYQPRPLLDSPEPIMSPAWSRNGRQIAYVSFEDHRAGIYIQDVVTGGRRLLSAYPGINGAPAWSPDGRRLALVLSKEGSPNIYILNIDSKQLTPVTHDFSINTEPAWSPDGRSIVFTSNRSGGPQLYQVNLTTGATTRLTYDGNYNARGAFTRDGKSIAMIHSADGVYSIALLDLDNGMLRILSSKATDSASPSMAPNDSMVLYDTFYRGHNVLGMVSTDGRVQLMLPTINGDAQDPAWSPYLS